MSTLAATIREGEEKLAARREAAGAWRMERYKLLRLSGRADLHSGCSRWPESNPIRPAALTQAQLARSLLALQQAQARLVGERLDWAVTQQRDVEEAALRLTKGVSSLYQRAAKWKAEQRRFRAHLEVRIGRLGSTLELAWLVELPAACG